MKKRPVDEKAKTHESKRLATFSKKKIKSSIQKPKKTA